MSLFITARSILTLARAKAAFGYVNPAQSIPLCGLGEELNRTQSWEHPSLGTKTPFLRAPSGLGVLMDAGLGVLMHTTQERGSSEPRWRKTGNPKIQTNEEEKNNNNVGFQVSSLQCLKPWEFCLWSRTFLLWGHSHAVGTTLSSTPALLPPQFPQRPGSQSVELKEQWGSLWGGRALSMDFGVLAPAVPNRSVLLVVLSPYTSPAVGCSPKSWASPGCPHMSPLQEGCDVILPLFFFFLPSVTHRQLCLLLNAENIFHSMADILLREEDLKFASTMVHTLNTILLTSSELFQLRNQLKDLRTPVRAPGVPLWGDKGGRELTAQSPGLELRGPNCSIIQMGKLRQSAVCSSHSHWGVATGWRMCPPPAVPPHTAGSVPSL